MHSIEFVATSKDFIASARNEWECVLPRGSLAASPQAGGEKERTYSEKKSRRAWHWLQRTAPEFSAAATTRN